MRCHFIETSIFAAMIFTSCANLFAADQVNPPTSKPPRIYRIMAAGDSITEGGSTFSVYRYPLWEKLYIAGYVVEFVGSKSADSRIGPLKHEGYGGKNAEFLLSVIEKNFHDNPADIVLLHAGHNYFAEDKPVDKIVATTESIIETLRKEKPNVIVLLAQVITSGKLPKYSYIPDLNRSLAQLAAKLDTPASRVITVDQASGWDFATDTIEDKVHPNAKGAEKMADKWFEALTKVLDKPSTTFYQPKIIPFKKIDKTQLTLHVFEPDSSDKTAHRPAIIYFFGGGWKVGTPLQFYPECTYYASKGFVAISADYRTSFTAHASPIDCVADAKSAIRYIRQHAKDLGVDPDKIIAAGASAGGYLAAATGTISGLDDPSEDSSISSKPNALVLLYPVIDNSPHGFGNDLIGKRYPEISPLHNLTSAAPPTLFVLGTRDQYIPVETAKAYQSKMQSLGLRCDLKLYEGLPHPLFEYRKGPSPIRDQLLTDLDSFLRSLGYLP